jgi:signal transduction histidine kinase
VRDTGPGIAPELLPRLFSEFVQLGSLKQRAHGTGLGLAICKRLVEAHGGKVFAESVPGVGSTFRVSVPIAGPEDQREAA